MLTLVYSIFQIQHVGTGKIDICCVVGAANSVTRWELEGLLLLVSWLQRSKRDPRPAAPDANATSAASSRAFSSYTSACLLPACCSGCQLRLQLLHHHCSAESNLIMLPEHSATTTHILKQRMPQPSLESHLPRYACFRLCLSPTAGGNVLQSLMRLLQGSDQTALLHDAISMQPEGRF